MLSSVPSIDELFAVIRSWCAANMPGTVPTAVVVHLLGLPSVRLPIPPLVVRPLLPATTAPMELRPVHVAILTHCTRTPTPAKQIARLADYTLNSFLREAFRELTRAGRLIHTPDGYALPPTQ